MLHLCVAWLAAAAVSLPGAAAGGLASDARVLLDATPVNTSEALARIEALRLTTNKVALTGQFHRGYEILAADNGTAREEMGVSVESATSAIPEAVTTAKAKKVYDQRHGEGAHGELTSLWDYQTVKDEVLYMHNIAATQEVIKQVRDMQDRKAEEGERHSALESSLAGLQRAVTRFRESLAGMTTDVQNMEKKASHLSRQISDGKAKLEATDGNVTGLQDEVAGVKKEQGDQGDKLIQLEERSRGISDALERARELAAQFKAVQEALNMVQTESKASSREVAEVRGRMDGIKQSIDKAVDNAQAAVDGVQAETARADKNQAALREEVKGDVKELAGKVEAYREKGDAALAAAAEDRRKWKQDSAAAVDAVREEVKRAEERAHTERGKSASEAAAERARLEGRVGEVEGRVAEKQAGLEQALQEAERRLKDADGQLADRLASAETALRAEAAAGAERVRGDLSGGLAETRKRLETDLAAATAARAALEGQVAATRRDLEAYHRDVNATRQELEKLGVKRLEYEVELKRMEGDKEAKALKRLEREARSARELEDHKLEKRRALAKEAEAVRAAATAEEDSKARQREAARVTLEAEAAAAAEARRRDTELALIERREEADLKQTAAEKETKVSQTRAEVAGRIRQERENEDIARRKLAQQAEEERKKVRQVVEVAFALAIKAVVDFFVDLSAVASAILTLTAVAAGVYLAREVSRVLAKRLMQWLSKPPPLVRETSKSLQGGPVVAMVRGVGHATWTTLQAVLGAAGAWPAAWSHASITRAAVATFLNGVILEQSVRDRVARLMVATRNARANRAPLRNALFFGPPGTGKTLVAQRLARACGLDFAIMSGGDVAPLGRHAVTELHRLFAWAKSTRKGLLLFIDEADAFLASRKRESMSEDLRNALNALLFHTSEQSFKFMLVMATNRPEDLDEAIVDRVDETLLFDLPGLPERTQLVQLYFTKHVGAMSKSKEELEAAAAAAAAVAAGATGSQKQRGGGGGGSGGGRRAAAEEEEEEEAKEKGDDDEEEEQDGDEEEEEEEEAPRGRGGRRGGRRRGVTSSPAARRGRSRGRRTGGSSSSSSKNPQSESITPSRSRSRSRRRPSVDTAAAIAEAAGGAGGGGSGGASAAATAAAASGAAFTGAAAAASSSSSSSSSTFGSVFAALKRIFRAERPLIAVDGIDKPHLEDTARDMDGFSGREISKTMLSVQGAVYGGLGNVCTAELFDRVLADKLSEHAEHRGSRSPLSRMAGRRRGGAGAAAGGRQSGF
eukprot:g3712.t1